MRDKVSIITTFHNSEKYIIQAINSVNKQLTNSLFDVEYIIIDDCSEDSSVQIINTYFDNYKNKYIDVKLIKTPENLGCGGARKFGIDNSSGNYLMFLDSDDYYLNNDFIIRAYETIKKYDADIVDYGIKYIDNSGQRISLVSDKIYVCSDKESNLILMFKENLIKFMIWSKIIKRSLIDTTKFIEDPEFDDIANMPHWIYNASKVVIMNSIEVNYRVTNKSLIHNNSYNTRLKTVKIIASLFESFKDNKDILKAMYDRCLMDLSIMLQIDSNSDYFKEMSKLNTYMLSYIYPNTYKDITYDVE